MANIIEMTNIIQIVMLIVMAKVYILLVWRIVIGFLYLHWHDKVVVMIELVVKIMSQWINVTHLIVMTCVAHYNCVVFVVYVDIFIYV